MQANDLGGWLAAIGVPECLTSVLHLGAETPHDLVYLEAGDIDDLNLTPSQRSVLTSAIARIEAIAAGEMPEASSPAPAAPTQAEHGHILPSPTRMERSNLPRG